MIANSFRTQHLSNEPTLNNDFTGLTELSTPQLKVSTEQPGMYTRHTMNEAIELTLAQSRLPHLPIQLLE